MWGASTISPERTTIPTCVTSLVLGAEENEVAGFELRAGWQVRSGVELFFGGAREAYSGRAVGSLHEPGAVIAARALAAPDVGHADLRERERERLRRLRRLPARVTADGLAFVARRPPQDLFDVFLRVVVGEDRALEFLWRAVRLEVARGGENRIGRVPAIRRALAVALTP